MGKDPCVTTKVHYQIFVKECLRLMELWGINDWKMYFEHAEDEGNRACCFYRGSAMVAQIRLSTRWSTPPTIKGVKAAAAHEVCHLLTARLGGMARARFIALDEIETEEERLAHHLHRLLLGGEGLSEGEKS